MEKETAIKTIAETVATQEEIKVVSPTEDDPEAKIKALEEEKVRLIESEANWKVAALKERSKKTEVFEDESEEDKYRRITREEIANSRLSQIEREKDETYKKAIKENKDLKLAHLNKTGTPYAAVGTHTESTPVRDTLVTPEQMAAFKAKGWSDKDIERYKKNLLKYGGR